MVYQNDDTETDTKIMYVVCVSVCNKREQDEKKSEEAKIDETRRGETRRDEMRRDGRTDRQWKQSVPGQPASQPACLLMGELFYLQHPQSTLSSLELDGSIDITAPASCVLP